MASYRPFLHDTKQKHESPAKVFARLKAKAQREAMSANKDVGDEDRAGFQSPRGRRESPRTTEENHRCYRAEVQAVTLSPIATPQKSFGHTFVDVGNKHAETTRHVTDSGRDFISRHGRTATGRAFLESTAVSALANWEQPSPLPAPRIRDVDDCRTNRTPVKTRPAASDCVFEMPSAVQVQQISASEMYSPMRSRLRKRKGQQDFSTVGATQQTHRRKISPVLGDDDTDNNTDTEGLGGVGGSTTDPLYPPTRPIVKRNSVMGKNPLMSPAKMFVYMKERESKRERQEVHNVTSTTRDLFGGDHGRTKPCDSNVRGLAELVIPLTRCRVETADRQSHPSQEDVQAQPVLLEDPILLNSPCISIPKKPKKAPVCEKLPNESVIYLKQWFLRKNRTGLFVEGIHREENIPWNSNIIVKRVSESAVETVSGRVYFLVGKMKMDVSSGFPMWFLKKFVNGFPPNWKALYEKFLSESGAQTKQNSPKKNGTVRKKSKATSLNVSSQQNSCKTPALCLPDSSIKVSRSGRTIKPPLEYWKGGRVILDAHMNVTIHECYDTSICIPEVTTTVSARKSQRPNRVFLPCSEGLKQCEPASEEKASAPLRKVMASRHKHNQAKTDPEESRPEPSRPSLRERKQTVTKSPESLTGGDKTFQCQASDEKCAIKRKVQQKGLNRRGRALRKQNHTPTSSESSEVSDASGKKREQRRTRVTKTSDAAQKQKKGNKRSPPTKSLPKTTQAMRKNPANKGHTDAPLEQDEDEWTQSELMRLQEAVSYYPKHMMGYWAKVAKMVGARSAEECYRQCTFQRTSQSPSDKARKPRQEKAEAPKNPDHPVISARAGTFKRKQQVRQFLEAMPKDDVDDIFSSEYMKNRRVEMPSLCSSEDHDFAMSDFEPLTPVSKLMPDVKTPQCLHITPGMMGSPNGYNDDKYVYQLQKRMKRNRFNVGKQTQPLKSFTPTPSVKQRMRQCGNTENDTFVVWEMFPGHDEDLSESGEKDFYFSDND